MGSKTTIWTGARLGLVSLIGTTLACASAGERIAEYVGHPDPKICFAATGTTSTSTLTAYIRSDLLELSTAGRNFSSCKTHECVFKKAAENECDLAIFVLVEKFSISRKLSWYDSQVEVQKRKMICANRSLTWTGRGDGLFRVYDPVADREISAGSLYGVDSSVQVDGGYYRASNGELTSSVCSRGSGSTEAKMRPRLYPVVAAGMIRDIADSLPEP